MPMDLPLPSITRYDLSARYLLKNAGALLFHWLLCLTPEQLRFVRWLPTQLTLPGTTERICDSIAELADLQRGGLPFAALMEVQTEPDATMPGRLMLAGGLLWLTVKPAPLPGDRYELLAIVINLTGSGDAARQCVLSTAEWTLRPIEVNLETLDAGSILDEIEAGSALRELLSFIPLMKRGEEDAIIQRWRPLANADTDPHRRSGYVLTGLFAERVGRFGAWQNALKGLNMIESPMIAKLLTETATKAKSEGKAEGKVDALLRVFRKRSWLLPEELIAAIRACADGDQLDNWLDAALDADTLEAFRQRTGL
jgi:hypothetical protein